MVTQVATNTSSELGQRIILSIADTDVYIMPNVLVSSIDLEAIHSSTSQHTITVLGALFGGTRAIDLIGNNATADHVFVGSAGAVTGRSYGILINATASSVENHGSITANQGSAVFLGGLQGRIINYGAISAGFGYGVQINNNVVGGAATYTENSGTISGSTAFLGDSDTSDVLRNSGTILGVLTTDGGDDVIFNSGLIDSLPLGTVSLGLGNDRLYNSGEIGNAVFLGNGNDLYFGQHGILRETLDAGDGNDTLVGNPDQDEALVGGTGFDLLDFRKGAAAAVALDLAFENGGAATGDTYSGFEALFGSITGADRLRGDGLGNAIFGFGGNDRLEGAGGTDTLRGGEGVDTLSGGLGNDNFRFENLAETSDIVTDFRNVPGDDDRFQIKGSAFGGSLVTGLLADTAFQSRADNLAQDADDRFIFRTTDQTLWFDADGTGGIAAVLVADLQAGASLTASDILIY